MSFQNPQFAPEADVLARPAAVQEVMDTFAALRSGEMCPLEEGLVLPRPKFSDGMEAMTYVQSRVASWGEKPGDLVKGDVIKFKTMFDLTEHGRDFEAKLFAAQATEERLSTKVMAEYRICRPVVRKLSVDELPQLFFNVLDMGARSLFPNRMNMRLVGPARPPLAREIEVRGDNSSDPYNQALEKIARLHDTNRQDMHRRLGALYQPALLTPATANGNRQLNIPADFEAWIEGILAFDKIDKLPRVRRAQALGGIVVRTAKHVLLRTNAA